MVHIFVLFDEVHIVGDSPYRFGASYMIKKTSVLSYLSKLGLTVVVLQQIIQGGTSFDVSVAVLYI